MSSEASLREQLASQRAHIVELVSTHHRREETLTTMLREMTEIVRHEIERADGAQAELERLRESFRGAVAVSSQRGSAAEPSLPSLPAAPSPAPSVSASNDGLPPPPPPAASAQPTRHIRYARALQERASHQKGHAASSANVAAAKEHFAAAKQASAINDHELACSHLEDAYVLNPKPSTLVSLANMHLHLGGVDIAKELYKHVLQDPVASQATRNAVEEKLRQCDVTMMGVVD